MKVLVTYKEWVDNSVPPNLNWTLENRKKVVEVENLLELDELFLTITDVKIL